MKYAWLVIILLLANCTSKKSDKSEPLADPLILDGRPYIDKGKAYRRDEAHLITSMHCNFSSNDDELWHSFEGMEQLVDLKSLSIYLEGEIDTIDFTPLASLPNLKYLSLNGAVVSLNNLKGLKQLLNLEELFIYWEGEALAVIDFSPLASLPKLESLYFLNSYITRLPDLTMLTNLRTIIIGNGHEKTRAMLESLEGIGAPNVELIAVDNGREIDSFAPLNNLIHLEYLRITISGEKEYKIGDMANLPSLEHLEISGVNNSTIDSQGIERLSGLKYLRIFMDGKVDLRGIEKLSALETLWLDSDSFNIEGIGKLSNLKLLVLYLISPEPSLEFLRGMANLMELYCEAGYRPSLSPYNAERYQVLDVSPLATLKNLEHLTCRGFIIKNISALDILTLDTYTGLDVIKSRLFDENEKSRYSLIFEAIKE
jgi:Leucine-rich repeat (LRR) protein